MMLVLMPFFNLRELEGEEKRIGERGGGSEQRGWNGSEMQAKYRRLEAIPGYANRPVLLMFNLYEVGSLHLWFLCQP